ncbi:MAG TPA: 3-hydroxyacyl-CoA dehydrogenase family protein [Mycobacteriales bacterium]|nr:3-hydroxyacyl-CoA dehydrogenase family protein [Mycobacteriales bacterium]
MTFSGPDRSALPLAVLGAGTMGRGIALVALRAGFPTTLVDVDASVLRDAAEAIQRRLGRDPGAAPAAALELSTDLAGGVAGVAAVIEAVPEVTDIKAEVYRRLADAAPPDALLASNTSTMSISGLAGFAAEPARVVGMHFFNPVHRMDLVEVVIGERTSARTRADALDLAGALGKNPIVVRDTPGFVTSRLGLLLGNEAMRLVEEQVASATDVDKAMRLGYRHPMGPLELADLVGLDARLNNVRSMYRQSGLDQYRPPGILERLVAAGRLGRKSGSGFYRYAPDGTVLGPAEDLP